MTPFLKNIAEQYREHYGRLDNFLFVFPSKRASTFFLRYLSNYASSVPMLAPRTMTIAEFVEQISGRIINHRISLLLMLYHAYMQVLERHNEANPDRRLNIRDFDDFRSIGEMMLTDFSDVDTHLVPPDQLFVNLSDLHEITTDFLTDDQKEVIEQYFSKSKSVSNLKHFWSHFSGKLSDTKERFLTLWHMLLPIYNEFNAMLEAEGLTYPGGAFRLAYQRIEEAENAADLIPEQKIVFVGFNVLTKAERKIFKALKKTDTTVHRYPGRLETVEPLADFVWDLSDVMLKKEVSSASRYVVEAMNDFPKPQWLDLSESHTHGIPDRVEVISSPSNAGQVKIAGEVLAKLHDRLQQAQFDDDRVAVVLPDEALLFPMINSIPPTITSVNLTMGCNMRMSPVSSFITVMRRMQAHSRTASDGRHLFFRQDVKTLLAHPLTSALAGRKNIREAQEIMSKNNLYHLTADDLGLCGTPAAELFRILPDDASPVDTVRHLRNILNLIVEHWGAPAPDDDELDDLPQPDAEPRKLSMDSLAQAHLEAYKSMLQRLEDALTKYPLKASPKSVYLLADRLISTETITFEGEPLGKLQMMGLLETRALDFEYVVIPSMNERIFPRRMRSRTLIPDNLRIGFGMPTTASQEALYAYYFYRLISRATEVVLIYDARSGSMRAGEPSRYIMQLEYLLKGVNMHYVYYRLNPSSPPLSQVSVTKDEEIMRRLERYTDPDPAKRRKISASLLKEYMKCPMKYYYHRIVHLQEEEEPAEHASRREIGDIVHHVMQKLYATCDADHEYHPDKPVTPNVDPATIAQEVRREMNRIVMKLPDEKCDNPINGSNALQEDRLVDKIATLVQTDSELPGFAVDGLEAEFLQDYTLSDGRPLTFIMYIDRIDRVVEDGKTYVRIVDYKTGRSKVSVDTPESIFDGTSSGENIVQLLLYTHFMSQRPEYANLDMRPVIYDVDKAEFVLPKLASGTSKTAYVSSWRDHEVTFDGVTRPLSEAFMPEVDRKIRELLDPDVPFTQTAEPKNCSYCSFRGLCGR